MAAAAYTGSLPVHPGASTACYWLVLHACSHPTSIASVGGPGHPQDSNLLPAGSADPCREGASTHGLGGSSETS
jgi:hypothetical protein